MSQDSTPYSNVTPHLTVKGAGKAIEFYKEAFGATERYRLEGPDGGVGHCELTLFGCVVMLADEFPGRSASPATLNGTTGKVVLMVENADDAIASAAAAGATVIMPATDMFYGYRCGCIRDPFGHEWLVQHWLEEVSPDEMQKRWSEMLSASCGSK